MMTMAFSGFIVWVALMVVAFLARNGWKIWLIYLGITLLFLGIAGKIRSMNTMGQGSGDLYPAPVFYLGISDGNKYPPGKL